MTVLVGLYCTDGVVVGTDSAATFTHGHTPTISQLTTKIETIEDRLIVATTGSVGLGQRLEHHIAEEWRDKGFQKGAHIVSTKIAQRALTDFQSTGVQRHPQLGLGFGALLAAPIGNKQCLIEYDTVDFQPEQKTDTLVFVSMGSAQPIADPFLGFIKRVLWNNEPPTVREGIFGALWTLTHTIALTPSMVGGPPQIAILERAGKEQWHARKLDDDDLGEQKEHCKDIEQHLAAYKPKILGQTVDEEPPDLPKPPSN